MKEKKALSALNLCAKNYLVIRIIFLEKPRSDPNEVAHCVWRAKALLDELVHKFVDR